MIYDECSRFLPLSYPPPARIPLRPTPSRANEGLGAGAYFPSPLFSRLHDLASLSFFFFPSLVRFSTRLFVKPPSTLSQPSLPLSSTPAVVAVVSLHPASFPLISPLALHRRMHRDIRMPFYWQRQLPSRSSLK